MDTLDWLWSWSWSSWGLDTSEVTGEETSLVVGSIKWVDEWVDTGAVSAVWDKGLLLSNWRVWVETSSVGVELEVSVGWIVWVDEWVEVWINWGIIVVDELGFWGNWLWSWLGLWAWGSNTDLLDWGLLDWGWSGFFSSEGWVESGSVQTVGTIWNMGTIKDSETVLASSVFDSISLTVVTDVRVLANSFTVQVGFFPENVSVFSGKSRASTAITGVKSLFFQDFGIFWVDELG